MNLCFVSQEYPPETAKGGLGTQTHLKAHGLAARGHEVHVLSHNPAGERIEYQDGAVHVIRIAGFYPRLPLYTEPAQWLTYSAEVAAAVWELHSRKPLSLLDFPEWGGEGYIHLLNRTAYNRIPSVIHIHGPLIMLANTVGWPDTDSEFYRVGTAMEATSLRLADAVFSSSGCSADWCARHYGLRRDRIPVLHTGVDTELFSPRDVPKHHRPTIIFVGRLAANKGVDILVAASARLLDKYPTLQLRLFGTGDAKFVQTLREMAQAAGLNSHLDLPGFIEREQLAKELSRSHVFAGPSLYEPGPGLVYLEAMACGLPVIACQGAGAAEVVVPETNGLLVTPGNVDALVIALDRLLGDPAQREAMGQRARQYIQAQADSHYCLGRLEDFYQSVASS